MPTFHVRQVVSLEIEVEADDALSARTLIDDAFARADPIGSPNVRLVLATAQRLIPSARVLDATPQAHAVLIERDDNRFWDGVAANAFATWWDSEGFNPG